MKRTEALRLRAIIEGAMEGVTDQIASEAPRLLREMQYDDSLIKVGVRINWNGNVKRAAIDMWDKEENNPDNAPTLWEDIDYKNGYRYIPASITVGTAFAKDECGWWEDELYRSLIEANVYTPTQYVAGWEKVNVNE